jgi:beta-glucosidase
MEPGAVELSAGSSSDDLRSRATLTVVGQTTAINREKRAFLSEVTIS